MLLKRLENNSIQDIIDKNSVKELIEFERFCRDNALWDEMKKCFAKDSTVSISWYQGSGEGFVEESSKMKSYALHKVYNTVVWINNNKAVSITMAAIHIRNEIDGNLVELQSDVKLVYKTQKIDDMWYIVSMDAIYEKDILLPVYQNSDVKVSKSEIKNYRPTYANLSYMLSKDGYKINQELPGIDRKEMVDKLYEDAERWLTLQNCK
ncbi:hypothetical protein [Clostridioides sp. ZZV14-6153]|uniref:hypothetical protein n=1 Tax=Clostridioides sp. ZZV14-6153 TaxID=2811494 RepID=UPI001D112ED0|nr:hypothetical protein [Clostridioides sp. ZZV14-6153]